MVKRSYRIRKLRTIAGGLSIIALHILSPLKEDDLTGIELAERLHITRGGVSRAAYKLNEFQLITLVHQADNHKNVYYHLTSEGKEIAEIHDLMHQELKKQLVQFIENHYSNEEIATIQCFLNEFSQLKI